MTRAPVTRALERVALALLAAFYFQGAIKSTLEWMDEGMIVYPSWRVAEGDLPYIHFQHLYGPSVFFVNGVLFRLFGADLYVLRLFLVGLKALTAVLVYETSLWVAPRWAALLAWAMLVAIWGTPIWFFNAPYASYYTTPLCLAGLLTVLHGLRRHPPRTFVAGLCCGAVATFKQTQGVFAFLSLALFTIFHTSSGFPAATGRGLTRFAAGLVRALVLLAAVGIALVYLKPQLATRTALLLLTPFGLGVAAVAWRETAAWPPADAAVDGAVSVVRGALGMALPPLGYAGFYWWLGSLGALGFNTVSGLPQRIAWFVPFQPPTLRTVAFGFVMLSTFAALRVWMTHSARPGRRTAFGMLATLGTLGLAGSVLFFEAAQHPGLGPYLRQGAWLQEFFGLLPWAPFCILAVSAMELVRGTAENTDRAALGLLWFFAAGTLLLLYPAADLPHVLMLLPAFLPLLVHLVGRFVAMPHGVPVECAPRACAILLVLAWSFASTGPFVQSRLANVSSASPAHFTRATGIASNAPQSEAAADLVQYLASTAPQDGGLLVIANQQMLYFLTGVRSPLQQEEFVLYLIGVGLVSAEDVHRLVDEDAMLRALEARRPLVVDNVTSPAGARFRTAFPHVARFLDSNYRATTTIGAYRVFSWKE